MRTEVASLTALQKEGAFLDAQGASPQEIATALDVNPKTISGWRRQPKYLEERQRWQEFSMSRTLAHLRSRATLVAERALEVLLDAMSATDPDGRPMHSVRTAAVKEIMASPIIREMFNQQAGGEGDVNVNAVVTLIVRKDGENEVIEYRGETIEEGEVVEDGDRKALEAGDDSPEAD